MPNLSTALIRDLADEYRETYAEGQRLHHAANDSGDDPELLARAYAMQDRATALAFELAQVPARTADDLLRKIAALVGHRYAQYPAAEAMIAAEARALLAA